MVKNIRKSRPGEIAFFRNVRSWDFGIFSIFSDFKIIINFSGINFKFILLISENDCSMSKRDVRSLSKWW